MNPKKIILLITVFTVSTFHSFAQTNWTFAAPTDGAGSSGAETSRGICTDASGNVYMVGVFNNAATDFNLGAGVFTFPSTIGQDGFISSYDKNGVFRWAVSINSPGGEFGAPSGAICTNGTYVWFTGAVNAASSPVVTSNSGTTAITLLNAAGNDAVVGKLDCATGNPVWSKAYGGTGAGTDNGQAICVDPQGCTYIMGVYTASFTMDGITAPAPNGGTQLDIYIAKFSPLGRLMHIVTGGAPSLSDLIVNGASICYVPTTIPALVAVGSYGAANPTFGTFNSGNTPSLTSDGSHDALLLELDTTLNITNAIGFGTAGTDELLGSVYDPNSGDVFVGGYFTGTSVTFPPSTTLNTIAGEDIMLARYSTSTNNFPWARVVGSTANEKILSVTTDGQGGIIVSGSSSSPSLTFGSNTITLGGGANDMFVARYSTGGAAAWAIGASSTGGDDARGVASYVQTIPSYSQSVFVTGNFQNSTVFSPGSPSNFTLTGDGGNDFFLAKINDASLPLSATQSQVNLTCNGVCTGSATVVASGGTAPYTYSWSPSGGSGATASLLCAINYTCTITDNVGNSITKTFNITQPPAITSSVVSQTNVSCFGGSNGAATITASGGTGTLTYNWTPGNPSGDGTVSVTGLTSQVYTCTITDANSCTRPQTVNITQPTALVVTNSSQTNVSCNGGSNGAASINLPSGGAGGYTYNWTPGNPTGDGTVSVTGLTAQIYTCTVTDANSCTVSTTFNITQPSVLVVTNSSQTNVSCNGGSNGAASINLPSGGAGGYTYNWTPGNPTGDGTVSVTGLTAQIYTCTVTDANSCTVSTTFNITQPSALVVTNSSQTNVSCNSGSNGAASINLPSGGAGGYTYNWTPGNPTGDGTLSVTGLTAQIYTCTVTDANSCTVSTTFNITQPAVLVVTNASQTNVSCNGGSNGTASINLPSGGAGGYTYNWTPGNPTGDGTVSITGLTAQIYTCTVTDANSCTVSTTFNITQPSALVVTNSSQTNVSCNGGSNGAASINLPSGGAGGYAYNWTPGNPTGDGTLSVTGLTAQIYTCTVTDANSCTVSTTFNITQPAVLVVTNASQTNVSCNGGSNGTASINLPSGGAGGYTYNWTPGNPTGDGTVSITGLTAQIYTCTVTDANSCTVSTTFNITQPSALVVTNSSQTNVSCNGGSNGAASINLPSGGAGGYTYNWTPGNPTGDGTLSVTGLTAQIYTCTVTDANSCTVSTTFNITQPSALVVTNSSQTNVSCNGGSNGAASINLPSGGAGGYTYNWTPGNPTGDGTLSVTGLTAQIYTCTVTDANSCTVSTTFNITQPSALVVTNSSQINVSCNGGSNGAASINLPSGGAGGYTYNWTPGNPTGDGTVSVTGLISQVYTCTVTDINSCTASTTFNITEPAGMTISIAAQSDPTCNGGTNGAVSLNTVTGGAGGYTYDWTPGNPSGDGTISITGLAAGDYTCTVTDANSCTQSVSSTLTDPLPISVGFTISPNDTVCTGSNITLTGTGANSYLWSGGITDGVAFNPIATGTYTVTGTDVNSCSNTTSIIVTVNSLPTVTANATDDNICNGESTTLTGGGASSYLWTGGVTDGVSFNPTATTTYTITGTDANSCSNTASIVVTVNSLPTVTANATDDNICNGESTILTGGGASSYLWTGGVTDGVSFNPTATTTYMVTGTDVNSCSNTASIIVTVNSLPTVTANATDNNICNGESTTLTGGGASSYSWTGGVADGVSFNPTSTATYTVTGTDGNLCSNTASIIVTVNSLPTVTANATDDNICNGESTTLTGGGASSYLWTGGVTDGISFNPISTTTYTVTGTDINLCSNTASIIITVNTPPTVTAHAFDDTICDGEFTILTGGGADYYVWSGGVTNGVPFSPVTSVYIVIGTDTNFCSDTTTINITINLIPSVSFNYPGADTVCINHGIQSLSGGSPSGGTYSGTGVTGNNFDPNVAGIGNHTIIYTYSDGNSCANSDTIAITVLGCSGIEINTDENIIIYPNPFVSHITIKGFQAEKEIRLYNALGETILAETIYGEEKVIDLQYLKSGVYFLNVGTVTKKIIKH